MKIFSSQYCTQCCNTIVRTIGELTNRSLIMLLLLLVPFLNQKTNAQVVVTFNSNGTFTPPAGVTSIKVEAWGGGAGGSRGTGGGGGGAFAGNNALTVVPATPYAITVGAGAAVGSGAAGGTSSFSTLVVAEGGGIASIITGGRVANSTGAAGLVWAGGNGGGNNGNGGAGGGGSAGAGGAGGNGNTTNNNTGASGGIAGIAGSGTAGATGGKGGDRNFDGNSGAAPGAGGGERGSPGSQSGGGGNGLVIVTYTLAPPTITNISPANACVGSGATITITGTNFTNTSVVKFFNNITATSIFVNSTTLTATLPASATTGIITVTTAGGTASSATFTVDPLPTANAGGVLGAICQGGTTAALGGSVGGTATGGIWSTVAGGTFSPAANNLNATWTPPPGYSGTATLTLTTTGGPCTGTATKTQVVNPTPAPTIGGTASVCLSSAAPTITFTNPQTLPVTVTYNINGGANTTINIAASSSANIAAPTGTAGTFNYNLVSVVYQSAPTCNTAISGTATIIVRPIPTATISGSATICQGAVFPNITFTNPQAFPVTITYNINGGSNTTVNVAASTTATVAVATGSAGTFNYNLVSVIYQAAPSCSNTIAGTATVIINPTPAPTISGTASVCLSSAAPTITFTNPQTLPVTVTYNINGGANTTINIAASSSANIAAPTGTAGTFNYNLVSVVYQSAPTCNTAISGTATIIVRPIPTATISGSATICQGAVFPNITFTNPQAFPVTITYNINGGSNTTVNVAASTTATVAVATGSAGTFNYNLVSVIYQAAPSCSNTIAGTATVIVRSLPVAGAITGAAAVCSGSVINLTPNATGVASLSYTWASSNSSLASVTNTGVVTGVAAGIPGITYTVTDGNGCSATSVAKTITVNNRPVAAISSTSTNLCNGNNTNITGTVTANGAWTITLSNGATATGAGNGSFSISVTPSSTITYTISSLVDANCTAVSGDLTGSTTITVFNPPTISSQPLSDSVCATYPVNFTVAGTGSGLTYQWYKGTAPGTLLVNNANISGATSATLNIIQADLPDIGNYYVVISGLAPCAAAQSNYASLKVGKNIFISSQPASQNVCIGTTASFNITADALGRPLTYQWRKNGVNILGAVLSSYTIAVTSATDAANYDVVLTTDIGCTTAFSKVAALTLTPVSVGGTVSSSTILCSGINSGTLNLSGQTGSINRWEFSTDGGGSWTSIANTTTSLNYTNLTTTTLYRTVVQNGVCVAVNSSIATITIKPLPVVTATPAAQPICSGSAISTIALSSNLGSTTYAWTRDNTISVTGIAASGTGASIAGSFTNTTTAPVTVTFTITPTANGCIGSAITATVIVNPIPNAVATPSSQTVCSGNLIAAIALTGNVATTTYNWTRNNTATVTGITASGSGDISGTLTNTSTSPVTVTFTITPTANGCTGTAINATITVNPTPTVAATNNNQTICSGSAITSIALSGTVGSTTFNWTRDNAAAVTGIAASGSGTSITGSLTNNTSAPVTVTFTIIPTANGCPGAAAFATVVVNPTPNAVATPSSQTVCSGIAITTIALTGNVAATTYNWTRNNTGSVTGIAASGSGNINGALVNTTGAPVTVTFTITTTANGCPGSSTTATVLVNPLPAITPAATAASVCFNTVNQNTTLNFSAATNSPTTYSISWNASPVNSFTAVTNAALPASPITIVVPANTAPGTYTGTITVRNAASCTSSPGINFTLTVNALPTVSIIADYCIVPGKVRLAVNAQPVGSTYLWSTGETTNTIDVDLASTYTVTVTNSNGCKASANIPVATELALNGDFNAGNTSFTTGYIFNGSANGLYPEGNYAVNSNPNFNHSGFYGTDHTTGTGNMMIVNGLVGPTVWQQTATVLPNTNYYFSAWALSVNNAGNYAKLQFSINGSTIGSPVQLVAGTNSNATNNNWQRFYGTWNSGSATSAVCSIVDLVGVLGGNDFAVDDVSISSLSPFINLTSAVSTTNQTVCSNTPIVNIVYTVGGGASGPTVSGLPAGVSTTFDGSKLTISGNPTAMGTFNYIVSTNSTCSPVTATGQIIVLGQTITQTSAAGTEVQNLCINTALTNIRYAVGGTATGAGVTGLPAGVTGAFSAGVFTISGTPTAAGIFSYTVTTTGPSCTGVIASGTLTVNQQSITITSAAATDAQTVCINTAITSVTYSIGGTATGAGVVFLPSLPSGITGSFSAGVLTISGTPAAAGVFTYTVTTTGTCSPQATATGSITVNKLSANPTAIAAAPSIICSGSSTTLTLSGGGGGTAETIKWYTGSCGGTLVGTGNNLVVSPTSNTTYYGRYENAAPCNFVTTCLQVTVNVTTSGTWLGITTDWNNAANWCGGVPTISTDVLIPAGLTNYPVLNAGTGTVRNITIQSTASATISAVKLQIAGAISISGSLDASAGTIEFNGTTSAQSICNCGLVNKAINNMIISNPFGVNISSAANDTINILDAISFGNVNNSTLNTGDNIILVSRASKTARVADITNNGTNSGNSIIGKVIVERFIPAQRAWRMLTFPIQSAAAPTFNVAWQEGVVNPNYVYANNLNPRPGYGMHISGVSAALGFDPTQNNNPSIKMYNPSNDTWAGIPNTLAAKVTDSSAYMVFVRGNRNTQVILNTAAPISTTVLRAKGQLKTGLQTINIPATGGAYAAIGNPFASTIDFKKITKSAGVSDGFVLWDPKLTGAYSVGAYQYFTKSGADYIVFPGGGSYGAAGTITNTIQSSQAMLIQHAGAGTLNIPENAKTTTSSSAMFRPSANPMPGHVSTLLYYLEQDSSISIADGALAMFNPAFDNQLDIEDFKKATNISENFSIVQNNVLLAINKKQPIVAADTIYYKMLKVKIRKYRFGIEIDKLDNPLATAFLEDSYLKSSTELATDASTNYDFTVTADSGAWNPNRFKIVFKVAAPFTFSAIDAYQQNTQVNVDWKVAHERNIRQYEVEKSTDGSHFNKVATHTNVMNNKGDAAYQWVDMNPIEGFNYYRIKTVDISGKELYSNIAKVAFTNGIPAITIYPNPVINEVVNLHFTNQHTGNYAVKLINNLGQIVGKKDIKLDVISRTESFRFQNNIVPGTYQVAIKKPDGTTTIIKVLY